MAVRGPVTCLSVRSGDVDAARAGGEATGLFVDDRRVLHALVLTLDGREPSPIAAASTGGTTQTLGIARHLGDPGPDPTVEVARTRVLADRGLIETVTVRNRWSEPVSTRVELRLAGDGAELHDVKEGDVEPVDTVEAEAEGDGATWADDRHAVHVSGAGAEVFAGSEGVILCWEVEVPPAGTVELVVEVRAERASATPFDAEAGFDSAGLDGIRVSAQDARLDRTVESALDDLRHLAMRDPLAPDDVFAGAGTPWYLTLFGRDSLWSARLALPFGTDLARGTLRALARRQGTVDDVATAQAPGKIPHEVRRTAFGPEGGMVLPAVYYGTVDATPLWICVLHDAWRWGLDPEVVRELAPALRAALGWIERAAAESPDGFLRYLDESGAGLANQGWKDSGDSMRDASGRIADGPIALVETQAYAVEAAHGAASLLEDVLGEDGSAWRAWGDALAARVRERFWVRGTETRPALLAMALDGSGAPVDGLGSNIGHTLATGLLDEAETRRVAHALSGPDLLGPLGISTLSRSNPAFNPIGYHTGSVWTHDSAIGALGLARTGNAAGASAVARALVDVAAASGYRWPELYGAEPVLGRPAPYPASCRPQAWAAASAGALVSVLLGLRADVPAGRIHLSPLADAPFGALTVEGLRLGGAPLGVSVDAHGEVVAVSAPDGIEVVIG
ncbi:glycogen debranching N-terminal domain-containing protein [Oryzobacter telluris]|uniref:glycogen debranching N-terminal domain-containing protein n=1 Tax=Oryzobacter telluris TaxID=3149179 RepID=UPI00370DDD69